MNLVEKAFKLFDFKKHEGRQEESATVDEKVKLILEVLGGQVVNGSIKERLSPAAVWLKQFWVAPLHENYGEGLEERPRPGSCAECPAVVKSYYDWPDEVRERLKRKPGYYCFGDALFKGQSKRALLVTDKVRKKCPLGTDSQK